MLYSIGQLNDEDSTYTMIVPTNKAWNEAYDRIKTFYTYSTKESKRDSLLKYHTKQAIVRDLVFSHTVQKSMNDSLVSTTGGVFENPFEYILSDYVDSAKCSNGEVFIVDELKHKPWDSWHTRIKVEAEDVNALIVDTILEKNALIYRWQLNNSHDLYTNISKGTFLEVVDRNTKSHPTLTFNMWDILKGKYDLKVVFLPQTMSTSKKTAQEKKPNRFNVKVSYLTNDGMSTPAVVGKVMENDPMKLDTVTIATIAPKCCSYGTESPGLQISIASAWSKNETNKKKYSTTLLIDCIILEPVKE